MIKLSWKKIYDIISENSNGGVQNMNKLEIYESEVKLYKKLQIISELTLINEHINVFQKKYNCNFEQFEKYVEKGKENFEKWDDYIEWKAYQEKLKELNHKIGDIENARDIKITK